VEKYNRVRLTAELAREFELLVDYSENGMASRHTAFLKQKTPVGEHTA